MATQTKIAPIKTTVTIPDSRHPIPPIDLIFDDGEPLESNRHRIAMNVLIRSLLVGLGEREDYFLSTTAGNKCVIKSFEDQISLWF